MISVLLYFCTWITLFLTVYEWFEWVSFYTLSPDLWLDWSDVLHFKMNVSLSLVMFHTMRLVHCSSWVLRNDWFWFCQDKKPIFLLLMVYEVSRWEVWSPRIRWYFDITIGRGMMVHLVQVLLWKPVCASVVDFEAHLHLRVRYFSLFFTRAPTPWFYKHPKTIQGQSCFQAAAILTTIINLSAPRFLLPLSVSSDFHLGTRWAGEVGFKFQLMDISLLSLSIFYDSGIVC